MAYKYWIYLLKSERTKEKHETMSNRKQIKRQHFLPKISLNKKDYEK